MKGTIIFNGNIKLETDFIHKFKDRILNSSHIDPEVRDSKKVLLITAAWRKNEFNEGHVKEKLREIGIKENYVDGYDQNVQNLSIYHDFIRFQEEEPGIYKFYHSKQLVIQHVKNFYREKNTGLIDILKKQLQALKRNFPNVTLDKALSYDSETNSRELFSLNHWQLLYHYACQDIQASMNKIRENDKQMVKVCQEIDDYFFATSGVLQNETYIRMRDELKQRVLSSSSIFIFGGHIAVLINRLNFFKLKDTFIDALNKGTNFYTVSAGSLCLCDKIIIYDPTSEIWDGAKDMFDFELFDVGFGLVKKVQIFPHCKEYIQLSDRDTIAYMAERFNNTKCIGMDEESFLLFETSKDESGEYRAFSSLGTEEGLYVLEKSGELTIVNSGDDLVIPGVRSSD